MVTSILISLASYAISAATTLMVLWKTSSTCHSVKLQLLNQKSTSWQNVPFTIPWGHRCPRTWRVSLCSRNTGTSCPYIWKNSWYSSWAATIYATLKTIRFNDDIAHPILCHLLNLIPSSLTFDLYSMAIESLLIHFVAPVSHVVTLPIYACMNTGRRISRTLSYAWTTWCARIPWA